MVNIKRHKLTQLVLDVFFKRLEDMSRMCVCLNVTRFFISNAFRQLDVA